MNNVYQSCPMYETDNFILRLVKQEDAEDLLACYSDKAAVARMNADSCTNGFYYQTIDEMRSAIDFWLTEYNDQCFVRFAIVDKNTMKAIGTVEMFDTKIPAAGNVGVLRIDIASVYESAKNISELTALAVGEFMRDFETEAIVVKAGHTPERAEVFISYGFVPTDEFRPGLGYYIYRNKDILK